MGAEISISDFLKGQLDVLELRKNAPWRRYAPHRPLRRRDVRWDGEHCYR